MTSKHFKFAALFAFVFACMYTIRSHAQSSRVVHADILELTSGGNHIDVVAGTLGGNVTFTLPTNSLTFPTSNGTTNYVLRTNGAGTTTWVDTLTTLAASSNSANGYLLSADWATFNAKVPTTEAVNTVAPLTGGGNLSAPRTIAIPLATNIADGYLSSTDWATFNSGASPLTTKGDLYTYSTVNARQPVGTNGQVLTADSAQTSGIKWTTPSGFTSPMTTLGDIIFEDATPTAARLAGNITATRNYLVQTGTGAISAAPLWGTIVAADLPAASSGSSGSVSYESSGTFLAPFTGAAGFTVVLRWYRTGKNVTLFIQSPGTAACGAGVFDTPTSTVPSDIQPAIAPQWWFLPVTDNSLAQTTPGTVKILGSGIIEISRAYDAVGFTGVGNCGWAATSISYRAN